MRPKEELYLEQRESYQHDVEYPVKDVLDEITNYEQIYDDGNVEYDEENSYLD